MHPYVLPQAWEFAVSAWLIWLKLGGMAPTTLRLRRGHVRAIARASRTADPNELTLAMIIELAGASSWSNEHRKGIRTSLNSFFDWCVNNDVTTSNPAAGLPRVRGDKPRPRPCPDDVWAELLAAAPPRERMMARLAGEVGMRRAEVAQCHRDDLIRDVDGYSLLIHGKGGKQRVVPVTDQLAAEIRAYLLARVSYIVPVRLKSCERCGSSRICSRGTAPMRTRRVEGGRRVAADPETFDRYHCKDCGRYSYVPSTGQVVTRIAAGYLFPGAIDGHVSAQYVGKLLSALMPEGWTMHKLRHRYATRGYAGTGDIVALRDALGHESVATTQIYTAVARANVRAVAEAAGVAVAAPPRPQAVAVPRGKFCHRVAG